MWLLGALLSSHPAGTPFLFLHNRFEDRTKQKREGRRREGKERREWGQIWHIFAIKRRRAATTNGRIMHLISKKARNAEMKERESALREQAKRRKM